jgi:hypothetical protein
MKCGGLLKGERNDNDGIGIWYTVYLFLARQLENGDMADLILAR